MKVLTFESKDEWLLARRGKITGSRLKDIVSKRGNGKKIGFYELIAERLATAPDGENPMDRGVRLEDEAIEKWATEHKKKVNTDLVIWARDDNENIAVSPDGVIGKKEAVEVKCLGSARHIEAFLNKQVPDEYEYQTLQYFIVNDKLETLHVVFYDPRMPMVELFELTIKRKDIQDKIEEYLEYQKKVIAEVNTIVNSLTF